MIYGRNYLIDHVVGYSGLDITFIDRIGKLYSAIDSMYEVAARHYHFDCNSCNASCCQTRFFHYTHAEYMYLKLGFDTLEDSKKDLIKGLAAKYEDYYKHNPEDSRLMCPLNEDSLCILYKWRPMICRLHGLPFETQDINMVATFYDGCEMFMQRKNKEGYVYMTINRTIYYREMARLEQDLRQDYNLGTSNKDTVAGMILRF